MPRVPRLLIAALVLLVTGCVAVQPGSSRDVASSVTLAPGERLSDKDLQERWWAWAASSPEERNPVVDRTGEFCGEGQPSDVWFFAGTFGGEADRACRVPAGRPLAGPAVNLVATARDCASFLAAAQGAVTLDRQPVEVRRVEPVEISYRGVQGNPMGRAGRMSGHACGLWAWLPPLAVGEHELVVKGESGEFWVSARYRLTVSAAD